MRLEDRTGLKLAMIIGFIVLCWAGFGLLGGIIWMAWP